MHVHNLGVVERIVCVENAAEWNDRSVQNLEYKLDAIGRNHRIDAQKRELVCAAIQKDIGRLHCQAMSLWRLAKSLREE